MAKVEHLHPVKESGWRSGFANMLRVENHRWWSTRRWWLQFLLMLVPINGLLFFGLWIDPLIENVEPHPEAMSGMLDVILIWMSILPVLNTIFVTQGAIIGEKQSGVAAWVLSAPVSRGAFILAKFIGNKTGLLVTNIWLQGLLIYIQFSLREGVLLPVYPIFFAFVLQSIYLVFYLALVIMLGTFFSSRIPVLVIPFVVLIGQPFIDDAVHEAVPWLSWALPSKIPELARFVHRWEPLPSYSSIIVALLLIAVFLGVAIWRFAREEF